jgi:formylglycine-generating enzyme required for sulfatase activity
MAARPHLRQAGLAVLVGLSGACAQLPQSAVLVPTEAGRVEVLAQGDGPLVVILSSAARGAHDFDQAAALLARQGFRVLAPEPRGSGRTDGRHEGISLHDAAEDVAAVIRHEQRGAAIVVGHAAGSFVARMLAVDHPELVRGVVLAAAGARSYPPIPALKALEQPGLSDAQRLPLLRAAYFAPGNEAAAWLAGWRPLLRFDGVGGAPGLAGRDLWWGAGDKPVLELQPLDDPFKPLSTRAEYRKEFGSRVSVVEIAHASHALFPEQPQAVVAAIAGWARSLPQPLAAGQSAGAGSVFQDCAECPAMVVVPSGKGVIGSTQSEAGHAPSEAPRHTVTFAAAFAVARYPVTRAQFSVFARDNPLPAAQGCDWRDPGYPQDASHPVVCVSWIQAAAYAGWLSRRTGQRYRLLSEAEYEFAARAGSAASYWWGDDAEASCGFANIADRESLAAHPGQKDTVQCSDGHAETAPVGSYRPNAWGLYDMAGNSWSWTADCWNADHAGADGRGGVRSDGDCAFHVAHGGSWNFGRRAARAAMRGKLPAGTRAPDQGFRLARDL